MIFPQTHFYFDNVEIITITIYYSIDVKHNYYRKINTNPPLWMS